MQRQMTDRHFGLIHTGVCMDPWGQRTPEWPSECTRLLLAAGGGVVLGKLFNGDKLSCHASDLLLALRDAT